MLNDEEKLIPLRKVHELEEATVKTRSANEQIMKENEDLRRMLRSMLEKEPQMAGGREESVYEDQRFSAPEEFKKNAEKGQSLFEDEKRTETRKGGEPASQVELMMGMMSSMQKMIEKGEGKREDVGEVEAVRNGQIDLPRLPGWNVEPAPLDLGDWMIQVEPIMGDLTTSSHVVEQAAGGS